MPTTVHKAGCAVFRMVNCMGGGPCDCGGVMPESAREFWPKWKMKTFGVEKAATKNNYSAHQACDFAEAYASSRVAALEQRIAELQRNLVRYGDHEVIDGQFACASFDKQPCNCGFDAALARLREVKG